MEKLDRELLAWFFRSPVLYGGASLIAGAMMLFSYFSFYADKVQEYARIEQEWSDQQQRAQLEQAQQQRPTIDPKTLERLWARIPVQDKNLDFLEEVTKYQQKEAIQLIELDSEAPFESAKDSLIQRFGAIQDEEITPEQREQANLGAEAIKQKTIAVRIEGSFANAMRFWRGLVRRDRFVDTQKWSIQFGRDAGGSFIDRVEMEFTLRAYAAPGYADLQTKEPKDDTQDTTDAQSPQSSADEEEVTR